MAIPHVLLEVPIRPADRAVLVSLLSFAPFAWDSLLAGRRLRIVRKMSDVAARAGLSVRSLGASIARLTERDLVRTRARGRMFSEWEVRPAAFGLADDDLERRREASSTRRRYVALPVHVIGAVSPTELTILLELLDACGSRPYSRLVAGERLVASFCARDLGARSGVSTRTVARSLDALSRLRFVDVSGDRGRYAIEIPARLFQLKAVCRSSTDLPNTNAQRDKSAEQGGSHHHEHEEQETLRGARQRAASIYPLLLRLVYAGNPRITSSRMRGRVSRCAHLLALAGVSDAEIERLGIQVSHDRGAAPCPEAVVDRLLARQSELRLRRLSEAQFSASTTVVPRVRAMQLSPVPASTRAVLGDLELRALRWQAELESGDVSVDQWRDLLGGLLPWEDAYVPIALRGHGALCAK